MHADLDDWEQAWLVNVLGPLELFRTAVPHLAAAGGGAIVVVSALAVRAINPARVRTRRPSRRSRSPRRRWRARSASTASASTWSCRASFPVPTPEQMFARMAERRGTTVEAVQEQMAPDTALRRLPTPDDIADAIVFLASDRAQSITGPDARRQRRPVVQLMADPNERIFYSSSVHDDREIDAVVEVLRSGPQGLWPGRRVVRMEREVAARFGKTHGVMCNSGSSALYLALELLDLPPGAEVVTCALTFSTDIAPIVRGGWVPVFVDCEPLTYCVDVDRIEEMITERTGALLFPNLIGNAPDWDRIAEIAGAPRPAGHRGLVRHPRCHAARHADRRALDHQRHQLRQLARDHRGGQRRHGHGRRRRVARPRRHAAAMGEAFRGQLLRLEAARARLLAGPRRHPLRQPVHLRRGGVELRAVGARCRVRSRAAGEARRQPRAPAPALRPVLRVLRRPRRSLRAPGAAPRPRNRLARLPADDRARRRLRARRPAGVPRRSWHRHPHDLDRQRHPPTDARWGGGPGPRATACRTPTR